MNTVMLESTNTISMVDALMAIFKSQSKAVRTEFLKRACREESDALSPELASQIALAEENFKNGNTVHFNSVDELDSYLDNL